MLFGRRIPALVLGSCVTRVPRLPAFVFAQPANVTYRQTVVMSNGASMDLTNTNVLGGALVLCGTDPLTGFRRDGFCRCGEDDFGVHSVCAVMTPEFLQYTKAQGNDLSTPRGGFPGLKPNDRWCLCAGRWKEAARAGMAPKVVLESTSSITLETVPLDLLMEHKWEQEAPAQASR